MLLRLGKKYSNKSAIPAIVIPVLFFTLLASGKSSAKVTGLCGNCHTMHNSQGGSPVAPEGPYKTLLVNNCMGCHSAGGGDIWKDPATGAPIVYNVAEPSFNAAKGLAGGNFYWVKNVGDEYGHNVFLNEGDGNLAAAPGDAGRASCGTESCHKNLHLAAVATPELTGKYGCEGCHLNVAHHADDGTTGTYKLVTSAAQGWYRFLSGHMTASGLGVEGLEDPDWQATCGQGDHNEYRGLAAPKTSAGGISVSGPTVTGFCCGCHSNFHIEQDGSSNWIRHPADAVLPTTGEYNAYTSYDPTVPVARPDLSGYSVPSSTVTPDADMVMCLSCHRPHGSPYPDILRWDYTTMNAGGGGSGGCFTCHTTKDD